MVAKLPIWKDPFRFADHSRTCDNEVPFSLKRMLHQRSKMLTLPFVVGVEKGNVFALRKSNSDIACHAASAVSSQTFKYNGNSAGDPTYHICSVIGRAIVDYDDFDRKVGLAVDGGDRSGYKMSTIESGDDETDSGHARYAFGRCEKQCMFATGADFLL